MVEENGVTDYMFGWHVPADSEEYTEFLNQYIAAISAELKILGISQNTYFNISDEPNPENIDAYKTAYDIIKPLIGDSKTFDALSDYTFYEKGLVECPVTSVEHIHEFLGHRIDNQWTYYCCNPQSTYTNSFMAMNSWRTAVLGVLLYKYDIKGLLHWGLNFYNSCLSRYKVNPYTTTSAGGAFPSGDPFILYPSNDGAYGSVRGKITFEAINDMKLCCTLEKYIGREKVVELIDFAAGMDVRFDSYPKDKNFLLHLREKMLDIIKTKGR